MNTRRQKNASPEWGEHPCQLVVHSFEKLSRALQENVALQLRKISFDGPLTHRYRLCLADLLVVVLLTIEIHTL